MQNPIDIIAGLGVVPVIAIDRVEDAVALADALLEGGLPVAEITLRTAAAAQMRGTPRDARPELCVGAGTVLDAVSLEKSITAGARFGLASGPDPEIVASADRAGFPFYPGVMTPSDLRAAARRGMKVVKFFPAGAAEARETRL
jgi:2-dehydro-3-deoxyphosphogluconate aldolase/(4S)-4-hydroxy-2-oxoglutarate aldolase